MKRKRNEMFKRSVAVILSVVMGIGSTPSSVFASETEWQTEVQTEGATELQTSAGTEPAPVAEEQEVTVETNAPVVETEPPAPVTEPPVVDCGVLIITKKGKKEAK